jgi:hypothetical protein
MKSLLLLSLFNLLSLHATNYDALLFHGNCTTCHYENKTVSAPSVVELRARYISAFPIKKDFVTYMATWVEHPREETSLMHDAIDKHGLMPELAFDLETLKIITAYIYETDFSKKHQGHKTKR